MNAREQSPVNISCTTGNLTKTRGTVYTQGTQKWIRAEVKRNNTRTSFDET